VKHVVSISLGSSRRNHAVEMEFAGEQCRVERIGTDGDMGKMIEMLKEMDGKVDCFGLGGMDLYAYAGQKRYMLRDAKKVARAVVKTPMVDGSGLKGSLEGETIRYLARETEVFAGVQEVLMTSATDRFGMALALSELGLKVIFGDLLYLLKVPFPIHSISSLQTITRILAPAVVLLPFKYLYPTGEKQHESAPKFTQYFDRADVIAGDFHLIRRNMPARLPGKVIITNTTTKEDVALLKEAGVKTLVTTTPELEGRSFGTNVMEALLVALAGKKEELTGEEYLHWIQELKFTPRIERLN
jgi:hypothetical protein